MMTMRLPSTHEPALSKQEAAMLPAMTCGACNQATFVQPRDEATFIPVRTAPPPEARRSTLMPRSSLIMPRDLSTFCPVKPACEKSDAHAPTAEESMMVEPPTRRGSMAGRSVLHCGGVALPGIVRMRSHRRTKQRASRRTN